VLKIRPLDTSYSAFTFIEGGYECYYCSFKVDTKDDYKAHVLDVLIPGLVRITTQKVTDGV
jgi:hypothetical protein